MRGTKGKGGREGIWGTKGQVGHKRAEGARDESGMDTAQEDENL